MIKKENNFAYIDGNNLYRGVFDSGWKIDYVRFRKWLPEEINTPIAYLNNVKDKLALVKEKAPDADKTA